MTVKILDAQLRDAYFHRLIGDIVNKYIGTEGTTRFPEALMKGFNISLEDVEIKTHSTLMDPQVKAVFSSIVDVVNAGVETYIEKHGYNVEVPEGVPTNKAYQIAVEEIEDEFETKNSSSELTGIKPEGESDPVGGDVSSIMKAMIDDLADRTSQDAKRVAETIIQMERERQNQLKSEDSEMENAEDVIDSEEMSDEEMDDIDDLDVEDPNKSDDENPLEDSEIEESLNDDKDNKKQDKSSKKEEKSDKEEEPKEEKDELDDENPFSALESVLDEGPALESIEIGTEGLGKLFGLITAKVAIKAAIGAIAGLGITYIAKHAIKAMNTQKMTGDEINKVASELEELATQFRDGLKALVDQGGVAKAYSEYYGWNLSETPVFKKEKVDSKRFILKANFVSASKPSSSAPSGIDPDELKAYEAKIQEMYTEVMNKGYVFFADENPSVLSIGYPKYVIETTPATEAIEAGTEGIREIWQGLKRGLSTARDIMSLTVEINKSQLEELKRASVNIEKEIKNKITALVKEANIEGLNISYDDSTWDVRDRFLNNYVVTLKIETEGDHDKNALKELFGRIDGACKEIEKDLNPINSVSKVKFGCGLVNLAEEDISTFYFGLTSKRRVRVVEDTNQATESYFIVDSLSGRPVYGTESTGADIPENYKLYNLGLFMRNLREKSYSDMKEGFKSSPMNGYVYTTYVTESEEPVILDGALGFRAVEIDKNTLDTSENFVVETVKLALKSARKFAIESVNKAELDPTEIGYKITKDNGIYTGYVTYKCDGLESYDDLCDNYGIESFKSDFRKKKFIESIENYGMEAKDPAEKLFNEMKVGYAKLKVAGYNAFAAESFIYEAYKNQYMNDIGTEGIGDALRKIDGKVFKGWFTRAFAKYRKRPYFDREHEGPAVELTPEEYKQAAKDIETLWKNVRKQYDSFVSMHPNSPMAHFYNVGIFKLLNNSLAKYSWKNNREKDLGKIVDIIGYVDFDDIYVIENEDGSYNVEVKSSGNRITDIADVNEMDKIAKIVNNAAYFVAFDLNEMVSKEAKKYRSLDRLALSIEVLGYTELTAGNADETKLTKTSENTLVIGIVSRKVKLPEGVAIESAEFTSYDNIEYSLETALESLETRHSSDNRINTLAMRNNKLSYDKLRNIYDSVGQEVLNIKYSKKIACESANVEYIPNKGIVFSFEKLEPKEAISKMISRSKSFTGIESLALEYSNGVSKVILPIDLHAEACEGFSNVAKALRNYKEGLEMAKISNITDIAIESIDGIEIKPFKGLHKGQILKAATTYTTTMMEESLKEKFNRYGVESVEFKNAQAKYQDTTKKLALAIATTVTVLSRLGLECDLSMIRDPELFMNI